MYNGYRRSKTAKSVPAADVKIHCVFPATIFSPGLDNENKTKHAVTHMLDIVKRAVTGVGAPRRGSRPRGVAFLAGPTGVGKTELAKALTSLLFGDETAYFSDCILNDIDPEPDGEEALADLRVIEGIWEAIRTGGSVELPPFTRTRRIDPDAQERRLRAPHAPEPVHASSPAKE